MPRVVRASLTPFGAALRAAREAAGMSVPEVALALGCSVHAVFSWERGTREPSAAFLLAFCRAVNLDPNTLPL